MISDEELKKIQRYSQRAIEDGRKGMAITLAMDPAVMFAIAGELLRWRKMSRAIEQYTAVDGGSERTTEAAHERG